jgi:hypothetical protein
MPTYYEQNKEKIKARAQAHYLQNKEKALERSIEWQKTHREKHLRYVADYAKRNPSVSAAANKRYREKHKGSLTLHVRRMIGSSKRRAAEKGWDFNLDKDYIKSIWPLDNCCPILGIPFDMLSASVKNKAGPSLDRVDSTKGYIKGNVAIISWKANSIKNEGSAEEHQLIASWITEQIELMKD